MLAENQHPANLLAESKLKDLDLTPFPNQLYLHQLMIHFLEGENHGLANRDQARQLTDRLVELDLDDPASLMTWMSVDETLDPVDLEDLSAQDVAQTMLQTLHLETAAQDPAYP